jgi:putative copper export protein
VTILSLVTNLALFLGLGLSIGTVAARWCIVPAGRSELREPVARLGVAAATLALTAWVLVLVRQYLEFRDPYSTWAEDLGVLLGTGWGTTWKWGVVVAAVLIATFLAASRGHRVGWGAATIAAALLGAFPSLTGHARGGDLQWVTVPADVLHVWAMGAWIGGLAVILWLERRVPHAAGRESLLPDLIPRFSPLAMVSVGVLAVSGLVGSWVHLDGPMALVTTVYGRWLGLKVVLVGGVLFLGAINFRRLSPRLDEPDGPAAMRRSVARELALAVVVLAVTAVLVRTSPG